jgi:hypothetical protein
MVAAYNGAAGSRQLDERTLLSRTLRILSSIMSVNNYCMMLSLAINEHQPTNQANCRHLI